MDDPKMREPQDQVEKKPLHGGDHHEESDVDLRVLFKWSVVLLVTLFVAMAIARWTMSKEFAEIQKDPENAVGYRQFNTPSSLKNFPSPQLQTNDAEDMKHWRKHEDAILNHYGWVNKDAQLVRVPIDRAMDMLLEKGLPSRSEVNDADLE